MKKTARIILFMCLVILSCAIIFTACGDGSESSTSSNTSDNTTNEDTPDNTTKDDATDSTTKPDTESHVHSFGEWVTTKEATCTEEGEQQRVCACGAKEEKTIFPTGHTEVVDKAVAVTCTVDGKTEGKHCTVCDTVIIEQITIPSKGHKYSGSACSICGADYPKASEGLEISYYYWDEYYYVSGIGTCTDTDIVIPSEYNGKPVKSISNDAFENSRITSVLIPDSVTFIGNNAFSWCKNLASITIPDSVTTIGDYAFDSCKNLASITIPDSVTTIGSYAFYSCESLTSITIPDSVTTIGSYAFYNCESLTSITIPNSVIYMNSKVFSGDRLNIYCEAASIPSGWFYDWNENGGTVYWAGEWEYVDGVPTAK